MNRWDLAIRYLNEFNLDCLEQDAIKTIDDSNRVLEIINEELDNELKSKK